MILGKLLSNVVAQRRSWLVMFTVGWPSGELQTGHLVRGVSS